MNSRKKNILIVATLIGLAIIAAALLFYYFYYYPVQPKISPTVSQVNFLIPGVPYYGFYNHFFDGDVDTATAIADVLGYWGDSRFKLPELANKFPQSVSEKQAKWTIEQIQSFFQDNGYETISMMSDKPGQEVEQIKKYVNPEKKIPVIISQESSPYFATSSSLIASNSLFTDRVVIGVFDNEKKVIVHDHRFGNNYEISYKDFELMFPRPGQYSAMLVVWPSADLKPKLTGPDYNAPYPPRIEAMDNVGEIMVKGAIAMRMGLDKKYVEALELYKEFINDPKLNYFPPFHRVLFYSTLARLYLLAQKPDEAIAVIVNKALPLNHDLDQAYNGWTEQVNFFKNGYLENRIVSPYYYLGKAYLLKGDKKLAKDNFEEALKINPKFIPAQDALNQLK